MALHIEPHILSRQMVGKCRVPWRGPGLRFRIVEKIAPGEPETSVQRPDAYPKFPVPLGNFPVTQIKFPVPILREFVANLLI